MIAIIVLSVLLVLVVLLLLLPYLISFLDQIQRFHIGKWSSEEIWKIAINKCAAKWLILLPYERVEGKYYPVKRYMKTVQHWQYAGLLLGLSEATIMNNTMVITKWRSNYLTEYGEWRTPQNKVDFALLGYAVLKSTPDISTIRPAMDWIILMLKNHICSDKMISYSQGNTATIRYVDTLAMVCPFLAAYAKAYQEPALYELAFTQLRTYRQYGLYADSEVPYHAYDSQTGLPASALGWGRGVVWYTLALIDTYLELPNGNQKTELANWIRSAADYYLQFQREDGGFSSLIHIKTTPYDSSTTAGMAYFYKQCFLLFDEPAYRVALIRCHKKLKSVTMQNGAVDQCQGDTIGLANFSSCFSTLPFAQGLTLRSFIQEKE